MEEKRMNKNMNEENQAAAMTTTYTENDKEDATKMDRTNLNGEVVSQEEVQESLVPEIRKSASNFMKAPYSMDLLADMVDECDRALEDFEHEDDKRKGIWKLAQISAHLQGMKNVGIALHYKMYACVNEDEKGERHISYCQQYNDGTFSPKMTVKQADMIMAILIKNSDRYKEDKKTKNMADKFFMDAGKDYLGKFRGTAKETFNIEQIMNTLYAALPELSTVKDDMIEWNRDKFYTKLILCLRSLTTQVSNHHKSYYIFSKEDLDYVAHYMKLNPVKLLQKLKEYGLLYLTSSSQGYQTNVRFNSPDGSTFTARMYCVYNLEYLAKINGEDSDEIGLDDF